MTRDVVERDTRGGMRWIQSSRNNRHEPNKSGTGALRIENGPLPMEIGVETDFGACKLRLSRVESALEKGRCCMPFA